MPKATRNYKNYINNVIKLDTDELKGLFVVESATKYKVSLRDLSSSASSGWVLGKVVYPGAWKHLVLGSLPEPGHEMHSHRTERSNAGEP